MGFLDRIFGTEKQERAPRAQPGRAVSPDEQAIQRYRYMVQNAPPETLEQAHAEAFARLTPEQRQKVLGEMVQAAPDAERAAVSKTSSDDPQAMARLATRTEIRQPGFMERTLGGGMGLGGTLLASFAAGFVGSMVAQSFFEAIGGSGEAPLADAGGADEAATAEDPGFDDGAGDFDMDMDI